MGEIATVVADNGGPSLLVDCDGIRQEWLWEFEGSECTLISISAPGAAVPFGRWAPIDTAPRNGTRVLLYRAGFAEDVAVCWWSEGVDEWEAVCGNSFPEPTHWMALPERPNVRANRETTA